jgi:hypothetical protein
VLKPEVELQPQRKPVVGLIPFTQVEAGGVIEHDTPVVVLKPEVELQPPTSAFTGLLLKINNPKTKTKTNRNNIYFFMKLSY